MFTAPPDRQGPVDPRWGQLGPVHDPYALAGFRARPTDVIITTAAKAGTTWMQQILHQIKTGGDSTFASIFEKVPWIEFPRFDEPLAKVLERFEAISNPRLFKTHCTFAQTPGVDVARIVLTFRDPRDVAVSMYHHQRDMVDEVHAKIGSKPPATFDEFFPGWMERGVWFRNVKGWWPERNRPNLLWLRYEDMKRDPEAAIQRIAAHMGVKLLPGVRERVLEHSSFAWMKAHSEKFTRPSADEAPVFKPGGFIRKGAVGERDGLMSPAQEKAVLDRARAELPADCLAALELA